MQEGSLEEAQQSLLDRIGEDPMNAEKLLPDLRYYYEKSGGSLKWPMLRHPLVYQIPFMSWKVANLQYEAKRQHIAELEAEGKYTGTLWYYERPYRLTKLMEWWYLDLIDQDDLRETLPGVWQDTEHPKQFGYQRIVALFKAAGFLTDMPGLEEPYDCTVYRGCLPGDKRGISWTLMKEKADWFAQRLSHRAKGHTYQVSVPARAVLAVFTGRGEAEVLVNPRYLKDIREIE